MGRLFILLIGIVLGGLGLIFAQKSTLTEPHITRLTNTYWPAEHPIGTRDKLRSTSLDELSAMTCFRRADEYKLTPPPWMNLQSVAVPNDRPHFTYPGLVKIEQVLSSSGNQRHHCGGTRIAPNWVLTAGHCVQRRGPDGPVFDMIIVTRDDAETATVSNTIGVDAAVCHSSWFDPTGKFDDDVALLYVEDASQLDDVDIAIMDSPINPMPRKAYNTAYFVGWGKGSDNRNLRSNYIDIKTLGSLFLLGDNEGRFAPCVGDSGGPLYVESRSGPRLVGVLSAVTSSTCPPYGQAFFVRVKALGDWIAKVQRNCAQDERFVCGGGEAS